MRDTSIGGTSTHIYGRRTYGRHIYERHTYERHAYERRVREIYTHKTLAQQMHARGMHTREVRFDFRKWVCGFGSGTWVGAGVSLTEVPAKVAVEESKNVGY
jgi:hypothetical protein